MSSQGPDPEPDSEPDGAARIKYQAELDDANAAAASSRDQLAAAIEADRAANVTELGRFTAANYDLMAGTVTRSRDAADIVQKASAAIAALYTGILGLVFSVTDNPLPLRGVIAPMFLGVAVVLSTAYVAYLGAQDPGPLVTPPVGGVEPAAWQRMSIFCGTTNELARRRSTSLRASVLCLGAGLIFIAAPFISVAHPPRPASATSSQWPAQPSGGSPALNRILYTEQVKEAAAANAAQPATGAGAQDWVWLGAAAVVAVAVLLVATYIE